MEILPVDQRKKHTKWLTDQLVFTRGEAAIDGIILPIISCIGAPDMGEIVERTIASIAILSAFKAFEYFKTKNKLDKLPVENFYLLYAYQYISHFKK